MSQNHLFGKPLKTRAMKKELRYYEDKLERVRAMLARDEHVEHNVVQALVACEHLSRSLPHNTLLKDMVTSTRTRLLRQVKLRRMQCAIEKCSMRIGDTTGTRRQRSHTRCKPSSTNKSHYLAAKTNFEFLRRAPVQHANMCFALQSPHGLARIMEHITCKHNTIVTVNTIEELIAASACLVLGGVGLDRYEDIYYSTRIPGAPQRVVVMSDREEDFQSMRQHFGSLRCMESDKVITAAYDSTSINGVIERLCTNDDGKHHTASLILLDTSRSVNYRMLRDVVSMQLFVDSNRTVHDKAFVQLMAGVLYPVTDTCTRVIDSLVVVTTDVFNSWVDGFRYCEV